MSAIVFCMPGGGHFSRLRPLIAGLSDEGVPVYVFTAREFQPRVESAGGTFVDLFDGAALDDADAESLPKPCRFVTFAGLFAEDIAHRVEPLRPGVIVYDSFAVIGRVVADILGLPRVAVCAGHAVVPERFIAMLESDPSVNISDSCREAVEILRTKHGLNDGSPFSYVSSLSPDLNVYCEPPAFLEDDDRTAFEPIAFYGSLPPASELDRVGDSPFEDTAIKVYVSFGTVVRRSYTDEAVATLTSLSDTFGEMDSVEAVISLGGVPAAAEPLRKRNVAVFDHVDQWNVLRHADLFVTHHGLNSTHEAIYHRVPMLSNPFFWDQPALAATCERLGLAIPLGEPRETMAEFRDHRRSMLASLERARRWEMDVLAARRAVVGRIIGLHEGAGSSPRASK